RPSGSTTPRLGVSPRGLPGIHRAPRPLRRHAVASNPLSRHPGESANRAHASRPVELETTPPWRERARVMGHCHCGYKGHGLLIFCWSWRCNCSPTQDMTTTHRFKYQTTWIKGLHDEKKSIVLFV